MPRNPDVVLATVECARWDYRDALAPGDDFGVSTGTAAGHYTRPSLAALHGPTYDSVVATEVRGPTLAEAFARAGYHTSAVAYSPQTTAAFGFDRGFDDARLLEPDDGPLSRGSAWRERLATSRPVRWVHDRLRDKHATFDAIPRDASVVEHARDALRDDRDAPLFLWIHFMGSHRPYGWDDDAISPGLSRSLATAGSGGLVERDPAELRRRARDAYQSALERVGAQLTDLIDDAPDDTVWCICGDHGEELGEAGYFLHAGHRRRVVDTLVDVPVFTRGLSLPDRVSLIDLPAHLTAALGIDAPDAWDGRREREHYLTIAPWDGRATVRYQTPMTDLRFESADLPDVRESATDRSVEKQLQALGYRGVG